MPLPEIPHITLEDIPIHGFTTDSLHHAILEVCRSGDKAIVANVNVNAMNLAEDQADFKQFLQQADYVFCDGFGVKWAAAACGKAIPERITYADWMPRLASFCQEHQLSLFLLGGKPGIAERAATALKMGAPLLKIAGFHHGYFNKETYHPENQAVLENLQAAHADILLVSFGMPRQEYWLNDNWDRVDTHIALCGGAALDYVAGEVRRAPAWVTDNGFEWLGRLLIEPRRLWRRYVLGNPRFMLRILRKKITGSV